ncbi:ATP-binding protein [Dyadobacter sediminis]|uniref:AAA family ATPase n=1 Tax=Dyadobacter sediminis TaxID=1493691 RepID=A0A5R9K5P4_9BACT|nr:ATP-binding protein [Dyadobacter sediminis]TLU88980.1 AAA family ATPase [Dyadobacter sediminis]GGC15884.1 hypothetical protein GCM10011325_48370 [Dyadobacter sediminis]
MESIFDKIIELPSSTIQERAKGLVGFDKKFSRIYSNLKLLLDQEGLVSWSKKFHNTELPIIGQLNEKYPLVILAGDAGTGKTVTAEAIADKIMRELKRDGFFLKLSTRVRGEGLHGQMGNLVNDAFAELKKQAGKRRIAFLLIDEADAIASTRSTLQMHQEEKAAVNTLIQKIDEIRELEGRAILFMSTNRLHFIDEAIIRRASIILEFERPDTAERIQLFKNSLAGFELAAHELEELAELTGPERNGGLGFSFSDIRLRVLPEAIAAAYPTHALTYKTIKDVLSKIKPSPKII